MIVDPPRLFESCNLGDRMRLLIMVAVAAFSFSAPTQAQEDNPVIPLINTLTDMMVKQIEENRIKNSPEYRMNEIQPGGLTRGQVIVVQQKLIERGYDVGAPDGIVGSKTMAVVGRLQQSAGTPVTGLPNAQLLQALLQ